MLKKTFLLSIIILVFGLDLSFTQTRLTLVETGPVATDLAVSRGASWADYDNDGDLDLFVIHIWSDNVLYENNGDGTFTKPTGLVILEKGRQGSTWGDFDNDGDIDLFISNGFATNDESFLFQNIGHRAFALAPGFVSDLGQSKSAAWGDYDNDGDLDLVVANSVGFNYLYENLGSVTNATTEFRLRTEGPIFRSSPALGCNWVDYDNDGDLDLFFPRGGNHIMYQNNGAGTLTDFDIGIGGEDAGSIGASWGDYDNDGDLDLYIANSGQNSLYQNRGDGTFVKVSSTAIAVSVRSEGSGWADFDNDGDLDLFVANSAADNVLIENLGNGEFSRVDQDVLNMNGGLSRGVSWSDYNDDGFVDLFVTNGHGALENLFPPEPNFLYRNEGNNNHWINIRCVGTFSNRSAIGAKIRIRATIFGQPVWQLREISSQTGYFSQNSLRAAFGLGDATLVDTILVEWPSGRDQIMTHVSADQFIRIKEQVPIAEPDLPSAGMGADAMLTVEDTLGTVSDIALQYRQGGTETFSLLAMNGLGGGLFQGTIPGNEVTPNGIDYRIIVTDDLGNVVKLPARRSYALRVAVADGVSTSEAQPHGSAQSAYRLFSVPLELDDKSPAALLADDLGEYEATRWRFAEYDPAANAYVQFPDIEAIEAGKAYWLLVSEPARFIDTGPGTSNPTNEEFAIPLQPGWNLIGNPFTFSIPAENFRLHGGNNVVLRAYDGSWNDPISGSVSEILPFSGYAIDNIQSNVDTLFIDPYAEGPGMSKRYMAKRKTNTVLWSVRIHAQSQLARDEDNVIGVGMSSLPGLDGLDYPEPPPVGEYVSLSFPRSEWGIRSMHFSTDFRPVFADGETWSFEVKSNIQDKITLSFKDVERVPRKFAVWLVDEALNLRQNLREDSRFDLASLGDENSKQLKLIIGTHDFIEQNRGSSLQIPTHYQLSQNFPNPFNPVTTMRYGLPTEGLVTIRIYDITGAEVATLVDEISSAGYHAIIWDGRSNAGRVASGVYFVRMRAGDFSSERKLLLLQ